MKWTTQILARTALLLAAAALYSSTYKSSAQSATATISDVAVSGGFDYTILLFNSGTTNLNSFWYGWTTSGNNLPSVPSNAGNTLGWGNSVVGNSIEWVNSAGTALAPGATGTFTFFSSSTPTSITTSPAGESVAYVHGIDFSLGASGRSTPVFSPVLSAVPEPSPAALLGLGVAGWFLVRPLARRRSAPRQ
jgi:hypothetical protein